MFANFDCGVVVYGKNSQRKRVIVYKEKRQKGKYGSKVGVIKEVRETDSIESIDIPGGMKKVTF